VAKKNIIAILREGSSKKGEKRVAITPAFAKTIAESGHKIIVQPAKSPQTGDLKRVFDDREYEKAGADISEDLNKAIIFFGLKEIDAYKILPQKVYYIFSHTHKGQLKNRAMLKKLIQNRCTLVDYELIRDDKNHRLITAFTYNAGYAGMVDTLWTLGKRLNILGTKNPFEKIPQSIDIADLEKIKRIITKAGEDILKHGTPENLPPVITAFLGRGKTSQGAQSIYDLLPSEEIKIENIKEIFKSGSRKKVYKIILRIDDIYKLKSHMEIDKEGYAKLTRREREHHYKLHPDFYESNLDIFLPYFTLLMNCVIWNEDYPRSLSKKIMKENFQKYRTLIAIGDITCDPNGSIEFSKETWIDNPVYIYNPLTEKYRDGFEGEGVAVMAVTNLPCEFSEDASQHFSEDLSPYLNQIISADYKNDFENSGLPPEIKRAVIVWNGDFTNDYKYMQRFID
jgi:alanine dehydrogenase